MGAATSLLHGDRDPSIAGMVLDSPFTNLKVLASELAKQYANLPKFVVSTVLSLLRKKIKKKAAFDIYDLSPIDHVDKCFIPALFTHGNEDNFIKKHHSQELHDKYAGEKNIIFVEGDHNSARPQFLLDSISIFFYNTLQCQFLPERKIKQQPSVNKNEINIQIQEAQTSSSQPLNSESTQESQQNQQQQQNQFPENSEQNQESLQNQQQLYNIRFPQEIEEQFIQDLLLNPYNYNQNVQQAQEEDEDEQLRRAIEESLKLAAEKNVDVNAWNEVHKSME